MDTKSTNAQVSLSTSSLYFQSSLDHLHYLIQCKRCANGYKHSVNTMEIVASLRPIQVLPSGTVSIFFSRNTFGLGLAESVDDEG